jgi:hypothetical protein
LKTPPLQWDGPTGRCQVLTVSPAQYRILGT